MDMTKSLSVQGEKIQSENKNILRKNLLHSPDLPCTPWVASPVISFVTLERGKFSSNHLWLRKTRRFSSRGDIQSRNITSSKEISGCANICTLGDSFNLPPSSLVGDVTRPPDETTRSGTEGPSPTHKNVASGSSRPTRTLRAVLERVLSHPSVDVVETILGVVCRQVVIGVARLLPLDKCMRRVMLRCSRGEWRGNFDGTVGPPNAISC